MFNSTATLPPEACPASAVITAARLAKTPLAIAGAGPAPALMFANTAFASLLGVDAAALVGRPLSALAGEGLLTLGGTIRLSVNLADGSSFPAAVSTATVAGPDGTPMCVLCSLVDARGDGADDEIARDATLLAQVAHAAGELMHESAVAASMVGMPAPEASAGAVALDAYERTARAAAAGEG